jgi:nucleotide-binding universal stress UspA family protein
VSALPNIKTILYCTELGPNAAYIFRYALVLAKGLGAQIVALHVVETLTPRQKALVEGHSGEGSLAKLIEEAEKRAAERLPEHITETLAREAGQEDYKRLVREVIVAEGSAAPVILGYVASTGADLVLMGAHTASTVVERVMGGTARKVVKRCPVPVMTVQLPESKGKEA